MLIGFDVHVLGVSLFFGQWVSWSVEQLPSRRSGEWYGEVSSVQLYHKHSGKKRMQISEGNNKKGNRFKKNVLKFNATQTGFCVFYKLKKREDLVQIIPNPLA